MDKNWNNGSNSDEKLSNIGFESLSLGQKLLSKCMKKTGISVSVRGIAVNTTSQIKTTGSAWKSEVKYESAVDTRTRGTLDDVSFPDLLGSSNREASVNNRTSEVSSVTNDNDRGPKDLRRNKYKVKHRLPTVQAVNSINYPTLAEATYGDPFRSKDKRDDDILGSDFLMPGMKGNHPLGFTNFIGKGVRSPPPPPPPVPYPENPDIMYQSYQQFAISRLKNTPIRTHIIKANHPIVITHSPPQSDSNWQDNKSDGYNEAELTTAIDSLNHSFLANPSADDGLTMKPYLSEKLSQPYLDLTNFKDNTLLLQDPTTNQLDERLVDQLENRMTNPLESTLSNQLDPAMQEPLPSSVPVPPERRRRDRFVRRKRFADAPQAPGPLASNTSNRPPRERRDAHRDDVRPQVRASPAVSSNSVQSNPPNLPPLSLQPDEDASSPLPKLEREPLRPRRPRHRPRAPRREPDEDNWRTASNTTDDKQENAATSDKNSHEKKHFKSRPKHKQQPESNSSSVN